MVYYASDSPAPSAPATQGQQRRHRKNHRQTDGTVSDRENINPSDSPRKLHKQTNSVAVPRHQNNNMGKGNAQRQRPISYTGAQMVESPAKEQAYAQSKFMASPAASALPMPKFSRSVPNGGARPSLSTRLAGEKTPEREQSSPEADVVALATDAPKSPLDLFFKADIEEKARARSSNQSLSPDVAARPATLPRNPFQQTGRSVFLRELDGDDDMPSPRTVPHSNNGRPQIGERAVSSPGVPLRQPENDEERQATTQSLKNLLFQTAGNSTSSTPQNQSRPQSRQQTPDGFFGSPSPFQRSSGPSTPQPSSEQQQNHYSLHYGNRNLSPLFKAARSETPPRQSSLRQEIPSDTFPNADSAIPVGDAQSLNTFARHYLSETARTAGPAELPQLPFNSHPPSFGGLSTGSSTVPVNARNGLSGQAVNTSNSSQIKGMEDDLRRMLKLNVIS